MPQKRRFSVAVRDFVEFSLRCGDLNAAVVRPGQPLEGIRIHQKLQKLRPENYQSEVVISSTFETSSITLDVNGRIDGVYTGNDEVIIEEIKTTYRETELLSSQEDSVHWGQLKTYACFYAQQHNLSQIDLQLTYYHIPTQTSREIRRSLALSVLESFVSEIARNYLVWLQSQCEWIALRDASIGRMVFPFANTRKGQLEISETITQANDAGQQTLIQAPTGVGKTIATLFPAIKTIAHGTCSKVFFLTGKTTGRIAAENAVDIMRKQGLKLKLLSITAKDKICFNPGSACVPEECEYAEAYYDRLGEALKKAFSHDTFSLATISEICQHHCICPFAFSIEMAKYVDCIICDYNYVFDPRVYLRQFFACGKNGHMVLVDEAHNLVDRGREMFSACLNVSQIQATKRNLSATNKVVDDALTKLHHYLSDKTKQMTNGALIEAEVDGDLKILVRNCLSTIQQYIVDATSSDETEVLLDLLFELTHLNGTIERYDDNYMTIYEQIEKDLRLKLFCLHPGNEIQEKLKNCR